MATPCGYKISDASDGVLDASEAEQLQFRAKRLYERERALGFSDELALQHVQQRLASEAKVMDLIGERNRLLSLRAKRSVKEFVRQFPTLGEGLQALLEGSNKPIRGSRFSVDYQARSNFGKYFGAFVAKLEEENVMREFISNAHQRDIYREMWQFDREGGTPGITGNNAAIKIAKAMHDVGQEMVARQNAAGAYIRILPGYVMRQTHDISAIRALGGVGTSKESQTASYRAWRDYILPLLDHDATFSGLDPEFVLRNIHQGLYTGMHGPDPDMTQIAAIPYKGSHASKVSKERVLHFKDADAAFEYNQKFGMKSLRDQVAADMRFRARSIALMETFGPTPRPTFDQIRQELAAEARNREDGATQIESLNKWSVEAALNEVTGHNDHPLDHSLAKAMSNIRTITMMAKMGGVVLSSFGDKAFLQVEMAYQGISQLETLGKQLTGLLPRNAEQKRALRLMGVALDGILGNVMGRYSFYHQASGAVHWAQKRFFDLNFMNFWNDANKAAAAELMSAHLAEHSAMAHEALPADLRRTLLLYGIEAPEWDAIRASKWVQETTGHSYISPDQVANMPDEALGTYLAKRGINDTALNRAKAVTDLETKVRTYLVDRTDFAVPSPGAAETKYTTLNTRAGTPIGEAVRLLMMFKSFPITILKKGFGREIYGRGATGVVDWMMHDGKGKFYLAQLVAMATIGGYLSSVVKDAIKGRTPKPLVKDGKVVLSTLNDAALRGGGLGVLGDLLFNEYDRQYRSFLGTMAGPVVGQLDPIADMYTKLRGGENIAPEATKFVRDNTPYANLFYIRPVLDYFVLWNLQEAMKPGSLRQMERTVEEKNQQGFFIRPSEVVR